MRSFVIVFALLLAPLCTALPVTSFAQDAELLEADDSPPLPRPRPERASGEPSASGATTEDAQAAIANITSTPQPVSLNAVVTSEGARITEGLTWRVFTTTTNEAGELGLVARSNDAAANMELAPGEYLVHVAYGRAQTSDTLTVTTGENEKSIILDAGALRLNAAVEGDIDIPPTLLQFDIYTSDGASDETVIERSVSPNEIITVNAGTYQVVSHFGSVNAEVRANLRVHAGEITDATLYHHASEVSFKLVSEPGGEAIADVEWTVQTPDGVTLFTNLGAFPETVLAVGEYEVLAKQGDSVFNRSFEVRPGPVREIEVLTEVY